MKNKLTDLNDHLFVALERLNDESIKGDKLAAEIERANTITRVAAGIVGNAALALKAEQLRTEKLIRTTPVMMLEHQKVAAFERKEQLQKGGRA